MRTAQKLLPFGKPPLAIGDYLKHASFRRPPKNGSASLITKIAETIQSLPRRKIGGMLGLRGALLQLNLMKYANSVATVIEISIYIPDQTPPLSGGQSSFYTTRTVTRPSRQTSDRSFIYPSRQCTHECAYLPPQKIEAQNCSTVSDRLCLHPIHNRKLILYTDYDSLVKGRSNTRSCSNPCLRQSQWPGWMVLLTCIVGQNRFWLTVLPLHPDIFQSTNISTER